MEPATDQWLFHRGTRRFTAIFALTVGLGGCASDYLNHRDTVTLRAGDAVKAALIAETADPHRRSAYDVSGLGKNGAVIGGAGGDLDCADIGGPVAITGSDPHGLDADNDGIGCE